MPPHFPGGPGRGPGPGFRNRPFPHFDYNIPNPGAPELPVGETLVETVTKGQTTITQTMRQAIYKDREVVKKPQRHIVRGTVMGLRVLFSGGIRKQVFDGRISTIAMQEAEGRLTRNEANKRRIDAAKKYYRYLRKIGYLRDDEYTYTMEKYAEKIGVKYINDVQQRGHTR